MNGTVAQVEAALDSATQRLKEAGTVLDTVVIPRLHDEVRSNVEADLRFNARLEMRAVERGD